MATEFILVNPNNDEIVPIENTKKIYHMYLVEDENGDWTSGDGKTKSQTCFKIRKTPFKDKYGYEVWEDVIIRINERKATISYKEGKFYFSYLYDKKGKRIEELFNEDNMFRLYANDMKKAECLYSEYRETEFHDINFDYNYLEDVLVSLNGLENELEEMIEHALKTMPFAKREDVEKYIEIEKKRLKKLLKSFKKEALV